MNGSAFEMGIAIATYELMAAATLLLVAKYLLPVFVKKGIYTMPQFLEQRFDNRVRSGLAVFWVALFVFVNISTVLYLGALAVENILDIPFIWGIVGLVVYAASFSIFGGLKAVVWTDVVQVVVLVIGGLVASYMVLNAYSDGRGVLAGLSKLFAEFPEKFEMIYAKDRIYTDISTGDIKSAYSLLPGLSVLLGGMWIANIYYWGNNQYIIQRALAAKNINEAQKGVAFAGILKLFMPIIVVLPGITAFAMQADIGKADEAFPWVVSNFVQSGFKGLVVAALVAAIGSSISSMVNSASTIFTLDIYRQVKPQSTESHLVSIGRLSAAGALIVGAIIAPLLGSLGQAFQYIQEYTGFISPGVVAIFLFGIFWKRTTANAALIVVILSIPLSAGLKLVFPEFPFIDRMGLCFLICSFALVLISILENQKTTEAKNDSKFKIGLSIAIVAIGLISGIKIIIQDGVSNIFGILMIGLAITTIALLFTERREDDAKGMVLGAELFKTSQFFNLSALAIFGILAFIYALLW